MGIELGTRQMQGSHTRRPPGGSQTRNMTADPGMSKRVAASMTFATDGTITGTAGDFSAFAGREPILVEGTRYNNGYFTVTAVAGDGSSLTVDPPPKAEGPLAAVVRTA